MPPKRVWSKMGKKGLIPSPHPLNSNKFDISRLIPLAIAIIMLILTIFVLLNAREGNKCLANPFVYGAKRAETTDSGKLICHCSFENQEYASFFFDSRNISKINVIP